MDSNNNVNSCDSMLFSIENKVSKLQLTSNQVKKLKNTRVKKFNGELNLDKYNDVQYKHIDVLKIVGYGIHNPQNWYEALDNKVCHKIKSFEEYDPETFPQYINTENTEDTPSVIEKDGLYYIYGEGTHRLTIAKCTGCKEAFVIVFKQC